MDTMRKSIMDRIIKSGALFGAIAKMYAGHPKKSNQFIIECFEQCHNKGVHKLWGAHLVMDIVTYRLDLIRIPLKEVDQELTFMGL